MDGGEPEQENTRSMPFLHIHLSHPRDRARLKQSKCSQWEDKKLSLRLVGLQILLTPAWAKALVSQGTPCCSSQHPPTNPQSTQKKHGWGSPCFWHRTCREETERRLEAACVFCSIHNLYFPSTFCLSSCFSGSQSESFRLPRAARVSPYPAVPERDLKFSAFLKEKTASCQPKPSSCVKSDCYWMAALKTLSLNHLVLSGWECHGPGSPAKSPWKSKAWITEQQTGIVVSWSCWHLFAMSGELCLMVASPNLVNEV